MPLPPLNDRRYIYLLGLLPIFWPIFVMLDGPFLEGPPSHPALAADVGAGQPGVRSVNGRPVEPLYRHEVIFSPRPEFVRFHAASLTRCLNGDVLAACRGDRPGSSRSTWNLNSAILLSRQPAGTDRWTAPVAVSVTPGRMDTNPVLWTDPDCGGPHGKGGRIWLFHGTSFGVGWQFSRIYFRYSDDDGRTWTPRRLINGIENLNTRCPPIAIPDPAAPAGRRILLPVYREYGQSSCLISDDDGATWHDSQRIISGLCGNYQPSLVLRADGTVAAFMRASGVSCVLCAVSDDRGEHWSPVEQFDLTNPFTSVAAARTPDPGDPGAVLLAYNDTPNSKRVNLTLAFSPDEGRSFTLRRMLCPAIDASLQAEYPAILTGPSGNIRVAYTLGRTEICCDECNLAWLSGGQKLLPAASESGAGWRGLPGLAAFFVFFLGAALVRFVYGRLARAAARREGRPDPDPNVACGIFCRWLVACEFAFLAVMLALAPHGRGLGDWLVLGADDILTALRALMIAALVGLALILFQWRFVHRAPARMLSTWWLILAGPVGCGAVVASILISPPQSDSFGRIAALPPPAAGADLRSDFQRQYHALESATVAADPDRYVQDFPARRDALENRFAAEHNLPVAEVAQMSPYWTGESFVTAPALQRIQPLVFRGLACLVLAWLAAAAIWFLGRRAPPLRVTPAFGAGDD
ncbi:MAG: exo-alpha-sialidase [Planctomycetota bacterium]